MEFMEYTESELSALSNDTSISKAEAEYLRGCYYYEKYLHDKSVRENLFKAVFLFGLARKHGSSEAMNMLKQIYDNKE